MASGAPPGALRFDMPDDTLEHLVGGERRGVEDESVGGGHQGCCGPGAVARVALAHIGENARLYSVVPACAQLLEAPFGPGLLTGGQEYFHIGIGANNRADVAPVENGTGRPTGWVSGKFSHINNKMEANLGNGGDF